MNRGTSHSEVYRRDVVATISSKEAEKYEQELDEITNIIIAEIKEAKRDIAENPSEEAWRRFLALKRQKMEEAMDEQAE